MKDLKPFALTELVSVFQVRAANCTLVEEDKPACLIKGMILSSLPSREYVIIVHFNCISIPGSDRAELGDGGRITATIERPEPNKPTRFYAVGDQWFTTATDQQGERWSAYTVSVEVERYRPNRRKE